MITMTASKSTDRDENFIKFTELYEELDTISRILSFLPHGVAVLHFESGLVFCLSKEKNYKIKMVSYVVYFSDNVNFHSKN